jgi:glucose/arabinose dehydrogenase
MALHGSSTRRRSRRTPLPAGTALALLLMLALLAPMAGAVTVPAGFEDQAVAKVSAPTAFAFTPDGRILITSKRGALRVYRNGALKAAPAIDLAAKLCEEKERGLLGVAVDPAFAANRFVYLYYTFKKHGVCDVNTARVPVNRLSRFVLRDDDVVDPASETVLLDNIASTDGIHNAGDVHFGRDGMLYVSVGDGGCDYLLRSDPPDCGSRNPTARAENVLLGKVLRITPTGGIPADNPFRGTDSARCNTGPTTSGKRCQETFAWGLRNPYRLAFDPNAAGTRFFIGDVGQDAWEEIDEGRAGADYGWNVREGHCVTKSTTDCGPPPAGMTNPVHDYPHSSGCSAVTAGAFVPNGLWPAAYDNTYLYGDFVCGKIVRLTPRSGGGFTTADIVTGLGSSSITGMAFGPAGPTRALYYTNFLNGGELRRIVLTSGNRAPVARAAATPTSGPVPLTVAFSSAGSSDPDGDALSYDWDFGDGSARAATAAPSHTYAAAGTFTATLVVRDGRGGQASASVRIDAGNRPPAPVIDAPADGALFRVGEVLTLQGHATDPEDGALPASALSWTVVKHHNTHVHPFLDPTTGNDVRIPPGPDPEDLEAVTSSYLEIRLTATDSKGLTTTVTRNVLPHVVDVRLATSPTGLRLEVNGAPLTAPATVRSWEGYGLGVNAPSQSAGGSAYTFASWSDGGPAAHTIVTPAAAATYTATFSAAPAAALFADGFETGDLSRWTGGTGLAVQGQHVFAGAFAARGASTGSPTWAYRQLSAAASDVSYSMRFRVASQGANNVSLAKLRTAAGGPVLAVYRGSSGRLGVINETGPASRTSAAAVSAGAWHLLRVRARVNGASGQTQVFLDGAELAELGRTESLGTTPIGRVQLGDNQSGRTYDVAFDDVEVTGAGGGGTTTRTFGATADARVQEATPGLNLGGSTFLKAEGGVDPDVESYLKFDLTGLAGTVRSARLRVFATAGTVDGPAVYTTSSGWTERGITWSNRPARSSPRDDKGAIAAGAFAEFDVTPFVTGNGTVAFALATGSADAVDLSSREAAGNRPELVVTTG